MSSFSPICQFTSRRFAEFSSGCEAMRSASHGERMSFGDFVYVCDSLGISRHWRALADGRVSCRLLKRHRGLTFGVMFPDEDGGWCNTDYLTALAGDSVDDAAAKVGAILCSVRPIALCLDWIRFDSDNQDGIPDFQWVDWDLPAFSGADELRVVAAAKGQVW